MNKKSIFSTRQIVQIALLAALSYVLMLIHLPYKHLGFLELEFSDIPAIVGGLAFGPLAGVMIELIKNLIKIITASTTGGVGELANFLISIAYVIPVSIIFHRYKGKYKTVVAFGVAMVGMILAGILVNFFITVPLYAGFMGGIDKVVDWAAGALPLIKDKWTLIIIGITPFNVVKGLMMSVVGYYTYKAFRIVINQE